MKKNRNNRVGVVDKMVWFDGLMKFERMSKNLTNKTAKMFLAYGNRLLKTSPYPHRYSSKTITKAGGGTVRVIGSGIMFPFQLDWSDNVFFEEENTNE